MAESLDEKLKRQLKIERDKEMERQERIRKQREKEQIERSYRKIGVKDE